MDKRWMAVVMGALLVGILVGGVAWARPDQSPQAADHLRKLTIPAAFFHPSDPRTTIGTMETSFGRTQAAATSLHLWSSRAYRR